MVYKTENFNDHSAQLQAYQQCCQPMAKEQSSSTSTNWGDENDDDDVILHNTQYFCLPTDTSGSYDAPITGQDGAEKRTQDITSKLKERLLKHLIDNHRAAEHFNSLRDAKSTPDGLKIKIKPHGALVETPRFKERWQETINQCEHTLLETLKEHLFWAQKETKARFDTDQKTAIAQLKDNKVTNKKAIELVQETAKEAHLERVKLSEIAQKKKTERRMTEKRKNSDQDERERKRHRQ